MGISTSIRVRLCALVCAVLFAAGCASVPRESADLSAELGIRLAEFERSHIAALHQLMDERRARVDEFLEREWTPRFATSLADEPAAAELFRIAGNMNEDPGERRRAVALLTTKLQHAATAQRLAMIEPLDNLERSLELALREQYAIAAQMNTSVTGLLVSAAEAADERERTLARFGTPPPPDLRVILAETDGLMSDLLTVRSDAAETVHALDERAAAFIARIRGIADRLAH